MGVLRDNDVYLCVIVNVSFNICNLNYELIGPLTKPSFASSLSVIFKELADSQIKVLFLSFGRNVVSFL